MVGSIYGMIDSTYYTFNSIYIVFQPCWWVKRLHTPLPTNVR